MRRRGVTALGLALALAAACGGGGPSAPGGGDPPPPPAGVTFTPGGTAGGNVVMLSRVSTGDPRELVLAVEARDVDDLYGAFFDLSFPAAVLEFEGAAEGAFLSQGGLATTFQIADQDGNLVVGVTRLGDLAGASGSGTLLTLRFRGSGAGTGDLVFSRNRAVEPDGAEVAGLVWVAGRVENRL